MISKQEAMVLLAELDLFTCTESIASVSISNSQKIRGSEEKEVNKSFLNQYKDRDLKYKDLSLYDYFYATKQPKNLTKTVIPHFVGVSGTPQFPVTETYARHILTVYRPWTEYPKNCDWIPEFNEFIKSKLAPPSAKMHFERAMCRYYNKTTGYEPKSGVCDYSKNLIDADDEELLDLIGLAKSEDCDYDTALIKSLDRGFNYKWDKPPKVRTFKK